MGIWVMFLATFLSQIPYIYGTEKVNVNILTASVLGIFTYGSVWQSVGAPDYSSIYYGTYYSIQVLSIVIMLIIAIHFLKESYNSRRI